MMGRVLMWNLLETDRGEAVVMLFLL